MLSALAVAGALTALAAGLTGAWSPCGFSMVDTIGTALGVPVRSLSADEARTHFDWFAHFVAIDNPTSSALTRSSLGWDPQEPDQMCIRDSNGDAALTGYCYGGRNVFCVQYYETNVPC